MHRFAHLDLAQHFLSNGRELAVNLLATSHPTNETQFLNASVVEGLRTVRNESTNGMMTSAMVVTIMLSYDEES